MAYIHSPDEFPDSLTVTLNSNLCLDYFPKNTQHMFSNNFFKPINCLLTRYEVALTDVYLNKSILRELFENNRPGQIFVTVQSSDTRDIVLTRNPNLLLSKWLAHCNTTFQTNSNKLSFAFVLNPACSVAAISFENRETDYGFVRLPKNVTVALGYQYTDFVLGTHVTETSPNLEVFQQLPQSISIQLVPEPTKYTISISKSERGDGLYEMPLDLISLINSEFEKLDLKISIISGLDETVFDIDQDNTTISFDSQLANIFRLDSDTVISEKGKTTYDHLPNLNVGNEYFLFLCDIVAQQHYSNQMIPLLRMTEQTEESNKLIHVKLNPLLYLPVKREVIESIQFEVKNELLRHVMFSTSSALKAVLHLRKCVA